MDLIEGGSERPPRRRASRVVWTVALVALAAYAAVRSTGDDGPERVAAPDASPSVTATAAPSSPAPPSPSWPAAGACGTVAYRPAASLQPLTVRTGVRLLVGGYGLRFVDADTGAARPAAGVPAGDRQVAKLVSVGDRVYALSTTCDGRAGRIYRVDGGAARPVAGPPAVDVVGGAGRVWAVEQPAPAAGPATPLVLRPVGGGRSVTLPVHTYPLVDSDAGLVVASTPPDPDTVPARTLVLDPTGARSPRTLGIGFPLAVGRTDALLVTGACTPDDGRSCSLTRVDIRTGRVLGRHGLPAGRYPVSPGSLSSDGKRVAFQLARPPVDRPDPGYPTAASDIAVLSLADGRLEIVPGLALGPETGAGLVFAGAADSWLFVSVSHGHHSHVYAWRPGVPGPLRIARLAGPVAAPPPLLGG